MFYDSLLTQTVQFENSMFCTQTETTHALKQTVTHTETEKQLFSPKQKTLGQ